MERRSVVSVCAAADPFARSTETADVTARVRLARGAARVNTAFAEQPEVRAELRVALGRVYGNLGLHDQAVAQLSQALRERVADAARGGKFRAEAGFTPVEQEVVFLTISRVNGCT